MRRLAALTLVVAACGDGATPRSGSPTPESPTAPAPRRDPPPRARASDELAADAPVARSPLLRDGDLGGWTPSPADCALALRLGACRDDAERDAILEGLSAADRIQVARAGLRMRDPAAFLRVPFGVEPASIDLWEQRRCAEVAVEAALDPVRLREDGEPYLWLLTAVGAPADATRILERLADMRDPRVLEQDFAACLRDLLRGTHVPTVVRLCRSEDEQVRNVGSRLLVLLLERTDADRAEVEALLRESGPDRIGTIECAADTDASRALRTWRARASGRTDASAALTRERVARFLLRRDGDGPTANAASAEETLGVPSVLERIRAVACSPGPWASARPEPWSEGLAAALIASDLPWNRLADAALDVPGCRTRAMAQAIVARLPAVPAPASSDWSGRGTDLFAFLETAAPDAFVWKLRGWAAAGDGSRDGDEALARLLALRDVASAPRIVRWCERLRASNWADVP